jgi:hypothetical protein
MNSPAEQAAENTLSSVLDGLSDSACCPTAKLAVPVEWTRYCDDCESDQIFVADRICVAGLVARCSRCGDLRVAPFTRTTTEAA